MNVYKRITRTTGRTFVVADLHGEITKLNNKLTEIGFNKEQDLLISVGDLIDRGEDSVACLRLINESWFECVRGNHEQMAIDTIRNPNNDQRLSHWSQNGGTWYWNLDQIKTNEVDLLIEQAAELPLVIEVNVNRKKVVICHANYNKYVYKFGDVINSEAIVWDRSRYYDSKDGETTVIQGADLFIFGHTPVDKVEVFENQVYIDTGAVFGKELTIIEL